MSKSRGIGVEPEEVITKFGADVLRLWVSSVDFVEDVRLSDTILKRLSEAYRQSSQQGFPQRARQPARLSIRTPTPCPPRNFRKSTNGFC